MTNAFFEHPILNSPYKYPSRHWELDHGQPTQKIIEKRRLAEYITPLPKPKKRKGQAEQASLLLDDEKNLSTQAQEYKKTAAIINAVRLEVEKWRALPNPNTWHVTPETARLLQHWRYHNFSGVRPFFCQVEADAHSSEFDKLGRILVLKARMNADLHMADDLKNTGKGNLFVIFGEPDIDILEAEAGQVRVRINGVDVFHLNTGEVRSDGAEVIACWFFDTDYNEESFFVRHAYFLGANDPYKALKTTLKAKINEEAWASLNSYTSRPFDKPMSGRSAVKVINHLGDEVMKVFKVG
jgi:hypothetical protein